MGVVALWFAGCGGRDDGRPSADVPPTVDPLTVDPCSADDGLEFQNILNFEGATARCDSAVAAGPNQASCLYFNYDQDQEPANCHPGNSLTIVHTPALCTVPADVRSTQSCLLATGQPAPSSLCSQTNVNGGTVPTQTIEGGGRCGTSHSAMHLVASNLGICENQITGSLGWGASLSISFFPSANGQPSAGFDASAFDGVSLWVRKGSGPTVEAMYLTVKDPFTDNQRDFLPPLQVMKPNFANCADPLYGPITTFCDASNVVYVTDPTPPAHCKSLVPDYCKCDAYWNGIGLTDQWHFVILPFDEMNQKGYGVPSPLQHLDTTRITSLGLSFSSQAGSSSGGDWDVWIDDIAFYRKAR
jgi:hypothetical protein